MFTLLAYSESQDTGGTLSYVAGLADQHVRVEDDNIVVPAGMAYLLGAYALGTSITKAQVESPSLRRTLLLDLPYIDRGSTTPSSPHYLNSFFYNPIPLEEFEILRVLVAEDATGAERETVLVWIGDGAQSTVSGEFYTVEASSSTTLNAYEWTNGALSLSQTLPAGRYQVVGFQARSDGLIAARLVFVGLPWRPGVLGTTAAGQRSHSLFRRGALGIYGEFAHDQPPTVDFLSSTADTSETVWLDLVKVG